jgi:polysaccharide deacetylase family protein (PEP-CTERM system associated)
MSRVPNLLTIDVEDYFHASGLQDAVSRGEWNSMPGRVEYNTRRMLQQLERHDVRATFFVLGWVAARYPELIREIHAAGHELASHGWDHELVYDQSPREFEQDVTRTKGYLEDLTGSPVYGYRAPSFSIVTHNWWALEILARTGHVYDSSVYPVRRRRGGVADARSDIHTILEASAEGPGLVEVPPPSVSFLGRHWPIAGGGFFRFYPLWITRAALRRMNVREGRPGVVYLHPWEIDPDQPRLPGTAMNVWRHYLNLGRTEDRLERLLGDFDFMPIAELLDLPLATPLAAPGFRRARDLRLTG